MIAAALLIAASAVFQQQVAVKYTIDQGLPSNDVRELGIDGTRVVARTDGGWAVLEGPRWRPSGAVKLAAAAPLNGTAGAGSRKWVIDGALGAQTPDGTLWFGSRQGIGRKKDGQWTLWSTEDGLPLDEFTAIAAVSDGSVWLGTNHGAIHFDGHTWEYRQGRRWLPHDQVRSIAVAGTTAYFATPNGIGAIELRPMTLPDKAAFFESEIDKRHRRTEFGYVLGVNVPRAGDARDPVQTDSDNDGLWTAMYGAGECFACAAGVEAGCGRAKAAFKALRFLGTVTQGGEHPAPAGFVARTVLPAAERNPNTEYTPERDEQFRAARDAMWKVMRPRWPKSADGKWFWKADTSSDELDGHFFFYGLYYDLVAKTEEERQAVRQHVAALAGHLVGNGFRLIDHDGTPTRWGIFDPAHLNGDVAWWEERGLNSLSMLSYLATAEHITGDSRFGDAARLLREQHGYHLNLLIPKTNLGAGAGNQSDDEMAFMCFYNLLRYERDPRLRELYGLALRRRWDVEQPELNPLFNYIAEVSLKGLSFRDSHNTERLEPTGRHLDEALDTLRRFPLDRFNWGHTNSHRKDVVRLPEYAQGDRGGIRGSLRSGNVVPVDERFVEHWNHDPWQLDTNGDGRRLADGASFLLPYYMGLYLGYVR